MGDSEGSLGVVVGHGHLNEDGQPGILSMQSTPSTKLPLPPPMTEEEATEEEMRRLTNPDSTRTLPDSPVHPDHEDLVSVDNAFASDYTGTTEDKRDERDPGPTSGPKFTTFSGEGGVIDRKKGNTTGPGLMTLGKRKRRKTKRKTKGRKIRSSGTRKSAKSRRSHKTRSKRRRSNKTRKSIK